MATVFSHPVGRLSAVSTEVSLAVQKLLQFDGVPLTYLCFYFLCLEVKFINSSPRPRPISLVLMLVFYISDCFTSPNS